MGCRLFFSVEESWNAGRSTGFDTDARLRESAAIADGRGSGAGSAGRVVVRSDGRQRDDDDVVFHRGCFVRRDCDGFGTTRESGPADAEGVLTSHSLQGLLPGEERKSRGGDSHTNELEVKGGDKCLAWCSGLPWSLG